MPATGSDGGTLEMPDASGDAENRRDGGGTTADGGTDAEPACPAGQVLSTSGTCMSDPCKADSCAHGVCSGASGVAVCNCDGSGYSGTKCETDIDECATAKCAAAYPCVQTAAPGYTCRGQFADWPMPDSTLGAKTAPSHANAGSVLTDRITGLLWQATTAIEVTPGTYRECTNSAGVAQPSCTWAQAKAYCDALALGNRTDWRLPTLIELLSLIDTNRSPNLPDGISAGPQLVWTSSPVGGAAGTAYAVHNAGAVAAFSTDLNLGARCVAGFGLPPSGPHYEPRVALDEVLDRRTGLTWSRSPVDGTHTWQAANDKCKQRGTGWRLPTAKELFTLLDPTIEASGSALLDAQAFPSSPTGLYWTTSSSSVRAVGDFWTVDLGTGGAAGDAPANAHLIRCVR